MVVLVPLWSLFPMEQIPWDVNSYSWESLSFLGSCFMASWLYTLPALLSSLHSPGNLALHPHVAQHRSDHLVTIEICIYIYLKKLILWGFLYIVFLFVFYSWRRELANCESNFLLMPADIFDLLVKYLGYRGWYIVLWSVLHPKLTNSSNPIWHFFKKKQIPGLFFFFCYYLWRTQDMYLYSWILYV